MTTRVLLVDDSPTALLALRRILEESGEFSVVGEARSRAEAVQLAAECGPDLICMDVFLGGHDGVDTAAEILSRGPARIVLVTGLDPARANLAFRALAAGALDVLSKPPVGSDDESVRLRRRFLAALSSLAKVGLLSGRGRAAMGPDASPTDELAKGNGPIVAFGASTGGPRTLEQILTKLPRPFSAPIVIVQHIERGYASGFAQWLSSTGHQVTVVDEPTLIGPGVVYLASDRKHLYLEKSGHLVPRAGEPRKFQLPSVDEFFESLAAVCPRSTFAALLSGMGEDGAEGLLALAQAGATTLVQSFESCVVDSMPEAGIRLGGARVQLAPEELAAAAWRFVQGFETSKKRVQH